MRTLSLLPLIALTASAQDPWSGVLDALRDQRAPGRYLVAGVGIDLGREWILKDEVVSAIQVAQLGQKVLTGSAGQQLKTVLKGPGWALFAPDGRRLAEGQGTPEPARIREEMAKAGWSWLRDDLKAHLARHPDDGQAWVELAMDLTRQAQQGWVPGNDTNVPMPLERRRRFLAELEAAVAGLSKVPELEQAWLQSPRQSIQFVTMFMGVSEFRKDPQVLTLMDRLAAPFGDLLAQDPENGRVWAFFYSLRPPGEDTTFKESGELLDRLGGVPGRPWPPVIAKDILFSRHMQDTEALLQAAAGCLDANLTPDLVRRLGEDHVVRMLQTWGGLRLEVLLHLKRVDEALGWLAELRTRSGSAWPKGAALLATELAANTKGEEPNWDLTPEQVVMLKEALSRPPVADLPGMRRLSLRLVQAGPKGDPLAWARLQADPLLDPWGPDELSWRLLSAAEAARFPEMSGWLLLRGDERLGGGSGLPADTQVEAALRQQVQPRLEVLDAYIKARPERLDARRERVDLLRVRMPHPRLEPRLVEDLERLAGAVTLPMGADPAVWRPAAQRVCGRLADRLQHWPFHDEAWSAYVDWSALAPGALRPGELLATLDPWPRVRGNLLPGSLPTAVSLAVARRLGTAARWADLDQWVETLWENGLQPWLRQGASIPAGGKGASAFDRNLQDVQQLLAWRGRALIRLGKAVSRETFRQELEVLRAGLGGWLAQAPAE